jgi:hypothetical protein
MANKCPICNSDATKSGDEPYRNTIITNYSCPRCGDYSIEDLLEVNLPSLLNNDIQKIAVLSHWVRTKNESIYADKRKRREKIILSSAEDLVENIIKQPPPTPSEQADKFVLWLGNSKHPPGELVSVQPPTHQSIMGSTTPEGFQLVLYDLIDKGILQGHKTATMGAPGQALVTLSIDGWRYYEQLRRGASDSRKAFMAMGYGNPELDKIVEETFKLAVKQTGFDLFALNEKPKAGLIDDRLRVEIQTSRFLIADLTHDNAGAYWEAGFAEGLGKPVIYTCEKKKFEEAKTHFDTNHHLTIPWDEKNPEEAAKKLKATIRATLPEQAKLTDD